MESYYEKGNDLYQFGFSERDHVRLSEALKSTDHEWLLSYDDCQNVRDLYSWAKIKSVNVNYSIKGSREKKELIITKDKK